MIDFILLSELGMQVRADLPKAQTKPDSLHPSNYQDSEETREKAKLIESYSYLFQPFVSHLTKDSLVSSHAIAEFICYKHYKFNKSPGSDLEKLLISNLKCLNFNEYINFRKNLYELLPEQANVSLVYALEFYLRIEQETEVNPVVYINKAEELAPEVDFNKLFSMLVAHNWNEKIKARSGYNTLLKLVT